MSGIFGYAAVAFGNSLIFPSLLIRPANYAAIPVFWYLVFHVWEKSPIWIRCGHCGKMIASNTPWICGFKQCRNEHVDAYPFVHRCEHCTAEPKAYQCHHCGKLIFLSEDELAQNFARCTRPFKERSDLDIPGLQQDLQKAGLEVSIAEMDKKMERLTQKREPNPYEEDRRRQERALAELDHQIVLQKKEAELASERMKTRLAAEANLPLAERAQKKRARKLERFDIADKGRALAKERYPEDSLNYKREMAFWEEFEEERSIGD